MFFLASNRLVKQEGDNNTKLCASTTGNSVIPQQYKIHPSASRRSLMAWTFLKTPLLAMLILPCQNKGNPIMTTTDSSFQPEYEMNSAAHLMTLHRKWMPNYQIIWIFPNLSLELPMQMIFKLSLCRKYGKKSLSSCSDWYQLFPWLEYSAQLDAAFCYSCRMFSTIISKRSAFVNGGYHNWKKALDNDSGFRKH